jgi:hypothetical protein
MRTQMRSLPVEEAVGMREDAHDRLNPLAQPVRGSLFVPGCWADQRQTQVGPGKNASVSSPDRWPLPQCTEPVTILELLQEVVTMPSKS